MPLIILLYFVYAQQFSGATMPTKARALACSPDTTPA